MRKYPSKRWFPLRVSRTEIRSQTTPTSPSHRPRNAPKRTGSATTRDGRLRPSVVGFPEWAIICGRTRGGGLSFFGRLEGACAIAFLPLSPSAPLRTILGVRPAACPLSDPTFGLFRAGSLDTPLTHLQPPMFCPPPGLLALKKAELLNLFPLPPSSPSSTGGLEDPAGVAGRVQARSILFSWRTSC